MKITINGKRIICSVWLFWLLFTPNLTAFIPGLRSSLLVFASLFILLLINWKSMMWYFANGKIRKQIMALLVIPFAYMCISFLRNGTLYSYELIFMWVNLATVMLMAIFLRNKGYTYDGIIRLIFSFCVVQGVICILMLVFPSVKSIANTLYKAGFVSYETSGVAGITRLRIYGIASDYTFSFQILVADMAALAFCFALHLGKIKYVFISVLGLLACILNGRTGAVIYVVCTVLLLLRRLFMKRILRKSLIAIIVFTAVCLIMVALIYSSESLWGIWFKDTLSMLKSFITGDVIEQTAGYYNGIVFPKGLGLVLGEGHNIFGGASLKRFGVYSDFGYINDLFDFGIIGAGIIYASVIASIVKAPVRAKDSSMEMEIKVLLVVFLFIANMKGTAIAGSSIYVYTFLLLIFSDYNSVRDRKCETQQNVRGEMRWKQSAY